MADRFWVGGTGTWNTTNTANWSTTDGGTGGASVPTSTDDVYFSGSSGTGTVTISGTVVCGSLITFVPTNSSVSISAAGATIQVYGLFELSGQGSFTGSPAVQFLGGSSATIVSNGKTLGPVTINKTSGSIVVDVVGALTSTGSLAVTQGIFTTNDYNVTATSLSSSNTNTRTINLGSSTVSLNASTAVNFTTSTNLTFNAGTSTINFSAATFAGGGQTFYNVANTVAGNAIAFQGSNTFNNLTILGRTTVGVGAHTFSNDQTISGILTLTAGTNATMRMFLASNVVGTTRTLTCAAVASLTDIDFRDITIAGAAAPVSGTRLGDCKGNSGITFDAPKTVYWTGGSSGWSAGTSWSNSDGGAGDAIFFPLAQDTAKFVSSPASGTVTINAAYNIGTIDMSARTSAMALSISAAAVIHGDWINGTYTALTGTSALTFAGRVTQAITSAGKTFTPPITINGPGTIVLLQDAFTTSSTSTSAINLTYGTFDANGYNVTLTGGGVSIASQMVQRSLLLGSGTCTVGGSAFNVNGGLTNLVISGSGVINMTSATAKTFAGAGVQTFPTLNQGGAGTLTVSGSNKFANVTNTYKSASTTINFTGGTTNEFTAFGLSGLPTIPVTIQSTNTTQANLKKATPWYLGSNSIDNGGNSNLSFTAGDGVDYIAAYYINGIPGAASGGNFFAFF